MRRYVIRARDGSERIVGLGPDESLALRSGEVIVATMDDRSPRRAEERTAAALERIADWLEARGVGGEL